MHQEKLAADPGQTRDTPVSQRAWQQKKKADDTPDLSVPTAVGYTRRGTLTHKQRTLPITHHL